MRALLLTALIASFPVCMAVAADPAEIGTIVSRLSLPPEKSDCTLVYEYDGSGRLELTLDNIEMNSAAKEVVGSLIVKGKKVLIQPKERYGPLGPVESTRWFTIRYVIQGGSPDRYLLVHDDSAAEGSDRVAKTELDLTVAGKGTKTITLKASVPPKAPHAEPQNSTTEQGGAGQPATRSESDSEGDEKPQPEAEERSR